MSENLKKLVEWLNSETLREILERCLDKFDLKLQFRGEKQFEMEFKGGICLTRGALPGHWLTGDEHSDLWLLKTQGDIPCLVRANMLRVGNTMVVRAEPKPIYITTLMCIREHLDEIATLNLDPEKITECLESYISIKVGAANATSICGNRALGELHLLRIQMADR